MEVCSSVEKEIRPIEEGYRRTVVYNLAGTGKGAAPSANEDMPEVAAALQEHIDQSPLGEWHLTFILEHQYTPRSMPRLGKAALIGKSALKGMGRIKNGA